ncbi:MAG: RluA family pseudouridine synthase [Chloroflexota bacterium]
MSGRRMVDPSSVPGVRILRVPDGSDGRVDRYVADATGLSRSYVQKLISDGRLTAGGEALRANTMVGAGTELRLDVPPPAALEMLPAPDIALSVVYEDDDILIIDKPAGLVVHPSPGHSDDTLVNALLAHGGGDAWGGIAGVQRPGIVHRLDRDTSGLIIVARRDSAQASVMAQLKARRVKKTYLALVQGNVSAAVGRIEAPIGRDPKHRTKMAVVPDGRPSVTGYRVRERFADWTLLELDLVTGRTHQIRVHLEAIGHPIAGDAVYGTGTSRRGPDGLGRLFLHAWRLELTSPSDGHLIRATAPLPPELESVLDVLRAVVR